MRAQSQELGAARAGMHFEIGVVAVGLAGEQRLQLQALGLREQRLQRRDAFLLGRLVAFRLAELDERHGVVELALELLLRAEPLLELAALAHDLLRGLGVVPEIGVFDARVQLAETTGRRIDVKDASSAVPWTARSLLSTPAVQRASILSGSDWMAGN